MKLVGIMNDGSGMSVYKDRDGKLHKSSKISEVRHPQQKENTMNATGSITVGGVAFGAVVADIQTADGHKYHFHGYMGEIGTPQVCYGTNFSGDFPGLDHIEGGCSFEVSTGSAGPGFLQITWFDLHPGQIGTLVGQVFGGGFDVGFGGGTWDDAEFVALGKKK